MALVSEFPGGVGLEEVFNHGDLGSLFTFCTSLLKSEFTISHDVSFNVNVIIQEPPAKGVEDVGLLRVVSIDNEGQQVVDATLRG